MNETDVKYVETCNLEKVWDSSDSLTVINLYPIYNSSDRRSFSTRWNTLTVGKERGNEKEKDNFDLFHIFNEVLGLLAYEETTFMYNLSS